MIPAQFSLQNFITEKHTIQQKQINHLLDKLVCHEFDFLGNRTVISRIIGLDLVLNNFKRITQKYRQSWLLPKLYDLWQSPIGCSAESLVLMIIPFIEGTAIG